MIARSYAVWQISAGPSSRAYTQVLLRYGVALIGPGDAGRWAPERDDDEFEGRLRTAFCSGGQARRRFSVTHECGIDRRGRHRGRRLRVRKRI